MKTLLIAAGALALVAPALAQTGPTAPPGAVGGGKSDAAVTTPVPPSSADPAPVPDNAPAAAPTDPKAVIAAEFPTYDKDGNGTLNMAEFSAWMLALKEKSGAAPMKAAEKAAWLKGAFATADTDKDKSVSQAELTAYLAAGG